MGYMHINNLYKEPDILALFRECFALEKIHGASAHITYRADGSQLDFFAGGCNYDHFAALWNVQALLAAFVELDCPHVTVYGEAYGGKLQKMKDTYGPDLRFVAFDVKIGDSWLAVPQAESVVAGLGMEFVSYTKISTDLEAVDAARNAESVQAIRNGMGPGKLREGVVLRPIIELRKNNNERIIVKHKNVEFQERVHQPKPGRKAKFERMQEANEIVQEWVIPMRLTHVIDRVKADKGVETISIKDTGEIVGAMIEDVTREAEGEIEENQDVRRAIGKCAALMYKERLKNALRGEL